MSTNLSSNNNLWGIKIIRKPARLTYRDLAYNVISQRGVPENWTKGHGWNPEWKYGDSESTNRLELYRFTSWVYERMIIYVNRGKIVFKKTLQPET